MKILNPEQAKLADKITIDAQEINSLGLMEQAAELLSQWICNSIEAGSELLFIIGKGGNGGDGLAMARMLANVGFKCSVLLCYEAKKDVLSADAYANFKRLPSSVKKYSDIEKVPFSQEMIIIDAMLGIGFSGEVKEPIKGIIELINSLENKVISIDIPSGMPSEGQSNDGVIIYAGDTLCLYAPKLNMLLPSYGEYAGNIQVIDLELETDKISSQNYYITANDAASLLVKRKKFTHKNNYGHALIIAGKDNMMGAAALATGAALRSGSGLVTAHIPYSQRFSMQANYPSAILSYESNEFFSSTPESLDKYTSLGIGCGLGTQEQTISAMYKLMDSYSKPMVLDADALNIIALHPKLTDKIPAGSILTPHLGELKRLVGEWQDETQKIELTKKFAKELGSIIIVKGAHSMIVCPDGRLFFNSSGTAALAKAGSGDVLTGFITGLLSRGYNSLKASILGVYIHGRAGEKAADYYGSEGSNSSDLIDFLCEAYMELE